MSKEAINLTEREYIILLGCLNDASSYPFNMGQVDGFLENRPRFGLLWDRIYKNHRKSHKVGIEVEDIELAVLALKQVYTYMDQYTLFATQDDVTLEEVKVFLNKFSEFKKK